MVQSQTCVTTNSYMYEFVTELKYLVLTFNIVVLIKFVFITRPCRSIAPEFERLSNKYPDVIFIKVDVDKCKSVARAQGISAMPTFQFYRGGQKFFGFRGASVGKLESSIEKYSAADAVPSDEMEDEGSMMSCTVL